MAKLIAPLLSQSASGSLGDVLTFSKRRTGNQVRFQRSQKDYTSTKRATQRGYFKTASIWWSLLTTEEQQGFAGYDEKDP